MLAANVRNMYEQLGATHTMCDSDNWPWKLIAKVIDHVQKITRMIIPMSWWEVSTKSRR